MSITAVNIPNIVDKSYNKDNVSFGWRFVLVDSSELENVRLDTPIYSH